MDDADTERTKTERTETERTKTEPSIERRVHSDMKTLRIEDIEPDTLQPRRRFDAERLKNLADDIERRGVLLPILVRPPQEPGGAYRIIAGERRWRATQLAGKTHIPVHIREMTDVETLAAQLAENLHRADITDIERGRGLRRFYEARKQIDPKTTWQSIAREVGLRRSRIHALYHLAELPEQVLELIETQRLSGSHGILLHRAMHSRNIEEMVALAEQAARPSGMRTGAYGMSVSRLRQILLAPSVGEEVQNATISACADASVGDDASVWDMEAPCDSEDLNMPISEQALGRTMEAVRPEVQYVVSALKSHILTLAEKQLLYAALEQDFKI